jgi:hypothetical protein
MQTDKPATKSDDKPTPQQDSGDYVLLLSDGSTVRSEFGISTRHNGKAVVQAWFDPQDQD